MHLLVLGGTRFVGRHLVEAALEHGHQVTLFNRGTHADVFPGLELVRGDRTRPGDLAQLEGRRFDAAIDTSGYVPAHVRASARLLAPTVGRYLFVSTISVYAQPFEAGGDEDAPLLGWPEGLDPATEEFMGEAYGPLKVRCEREVTAAFGERALVLRPGVVVGPHDPTDRFTYWVRRAARGGRLLAPDGPGTTTQWIDGRDLAAFGVAGLERGLAGTFNVVTPAGAHTLGGLIEAGRAVAGSDAEPVWVPEAFLLEREVAPFTEVPMWVPAAWAGLMQASSERAHAAGLSTRAVEATVRDTLAWDRERGEPELQAGLDAARERELLAAWEARA